MKKKLLALAVAGALTAPVAAMADTSNVNIYGQARVSFDNVSNGGGAADGTPSTSWSKVSSNGSRLGLKGTEDLGGGMNAVWQIETQLAIDNSGAGNGLATRNTFAGLSGESWGSLVLGRNDSPYKTSTRRLDMFVDSIADSRTLLGAANGATSVTGVAGGSGGFDGRTTDSITYTSPSMSGFSVAAQYGATAAEAAAAATIAPTAAGEKGDIWSLSAGYDVAPIYVSLAYEAHSLANGNLGAALGQVKERAWRLGAAYKVDQFEANFIYENTNDDAGGKATASTVAALNAACAGLAVGTNCLGHHAYQVAGKYNISSSDAVKAQYVKANDLNIGGGGQSTSANQFSVGYDHAMSKRTTVYALYTRLNNNTNVNYGLGAAGYSTGFQAAAAAGADPSAFALGLNHTF